MQIRMCYYLYTNFKKKDPERNHVWLQQCAGTGAGEEENSRGTKTTGKELMVLLDGNLNSHLCRGRRGSGQSPSFHMITEIPFINSGEKFGRQQYAQQRLILDCMRHAASTAQRTAKVWLNLQQGLLKFYSHWGNNNAPLPQRVLRW